MKNEVSNMVGIRSYANGCNGLLVLVDSSLRSEKIAFETPKKLLKIPDTRRV